MPVAATKGTIRGPAGHVIAESRNGSEDLIALADAVNGLARLNHATCEWLRQVARKLQEQGVGSFAAYLEGQASQLLRENERYSIAWQRADSFKELAINTGAPVLEQAPVMPATSTPEPQIALSISLAYCDV